MKLNIVPARTGIAWVKLGLRTFVRQPLALTGLFFMYAATLLFSLVIPLAGPLLASLLVPAGSLGLMAAAAEASEGRFPMPTLLVAGFRKGRGETRAMLALGLVYFALSSLLTLVLYLGMGEGAGNPQQVRASPALLFVALLQLPMLLIFFLAPGLVHWHGVSAAKSLFFSVIAFWRNLGAFAVFIAAWWMILFGCVLAIGLVLGLLGVKPSVESLSPIVLLAGTVISTSMYFTFRDSFRDDAPGEPPAVLPGGEQP